jgi:ArsR family transcriptional regulator
MTDSASVERIIGELLLKEATDNGVIGDLLDIGTGTGRLLQWLAPHARQATGVDISADALRVARTAVHGAGLARCVLQQGDMYALPFPPDSFDLITMDRLLADARRPAAALQEAARVLKPGGRLALIEDYDRLAEAPAGGRNVLATLRGWLDAAGLDCERLRPVDTGTRHLILAMGRRRDRLNLAA